MLTSHKQENIFTDLISCSGAQQTISLGLSFLQTQLLGQLSHIQLKSTWNVQQARHKLSRKSKLSTFKNNNKDNKANNFNLSSEMKGHCDHQIATPNILPGRTLPWPMCFCKPGARLPTGTSPSLELPILQCLPTAQVANSFIFRRTGVWLHSKSSQGPAGGILVYFL